MNQLAIPFPAAAHRKARMRKAVEATEKADADSAGWSQRACEYIRRFAAQREGDWLTEEFITWSRAAGLDQPENKKAFGTPIAMSARRGVIVQVGWSKNTRNASPKPTWRRA